MTSCDWFAVYCGIGIITMIWLVVEHGWPEDPWGTGPGAFFFMWAIWPLIWGSVIWSIASEKFKDDK